MRSRVRENLPAACGASLGILVVSWLGLTNWAWTDYDTETRPAFDALLDGHLLRFLQLAPAYGGSLIMRAPFVLASKLWHGGELSTFRAAAAPCVVASAILGVWLVARMRGLGQSRQARAIALFLCVANPVVLPTLESGHPEELLGSALCLAAVLLAMGRRPLWSGVLLGLAIANKEWALLAVGPVLIALPERRLQALLSAAAVAAAVLAPLALAGGLVSKVHVAATQANVIFNPWQVWWFFGTHAHVIRDASGHIIPGHLWANRVSPSWVGSLSHPLIILAAAPLTWLCVWLRRNGSPRPGGEPLLLLALLLLARCVFDPWDVVYYSLPFLLALLAWEALNRSRPPALALAGSFLAWFVFQWATPAHGFSPDGQSLVFMALALPALAMLAIALYAPGLSERLRAAFARRRMIPATG
jgi:alpha-1,6-mannosyltransferase